MTYPGEPPPPPPPAPPSSVTGRRLKRPYVCGVIALAASAGLVASVFWAWLVPVLGSGDEMTGWEVYQAAGDTGENSFLISDAFREGFSPLFTGLSVVIAGGLLGAGALLLLFSPKVSQPNRYAIGRGMAVLVMTLGFLAMVPPFVNIGSFTFTQPRPWLINIGVGLITSVLFALAGYGMLAIGGYGRTGSLRKGTARR